MERPDSNVSTTFGADWTGHYFFVNGRHLPKGIEGEEGIKALLYGIWPQSVRWQAYDAAFDAR